MSVTNDPNDPRLKQVSKDGQNEVYLVLSDDERAKGFVRPVRRTYRHVGIPGPVGALRDLTDDERKRFGKYAKLEIQGDGTAVRYWTQVDLDRVGKACGTTTTMGTAIAETYARDPWFYGSTYCVTCRKHIPVGEHGEFVWDGTNERVGT